MLTKVGQFNQFLWKTIKVKKINFSFSYKLLIRYRSCLFATLIKNSGLEIALQWRL